MSKSPDAFRTISEVSEWLDVPAHVLRFWESKFTQVKPVKRAGGRRYYRPSDMALLSGIKQLLYDDGLTIRGVQKRLREDGVRAVSDLSQPLDIELDDAPEAPYTHVDLPDELPGETVPFTGRRVDVRRKKPEAASDAPPTNGAAVERPSTDAPPPLTNEGAPAPEAPAQPPVTTEQPHSDAATSAETAIELQTSEAPQPVASASTVEAPPTTATPPAAEAPASPDGAPESQFNDPADAPVAPTPPQVDTIAPAERVSESPTQSALDPATAPELPQGAAPAPVRHAAEAPTSPAPAAAATSTTTEPPQAEASVTAGPSDEAATPLDFGATEASATESPQRAEKPLTEERFDEAISSPAPPEVIPPTAAEPIQTEASVAHPANEATGTPALQTSNLEETAEPSQMESVEATSTDESTTPPVSAEAPLTPTQTQSEAPTAAEASPTKPHSNETAASPEASVASASPQPEANSTEIARNEPEKPDSATTEPSFAADSAAGQSEPTASEVLELQASTATDKTESFALGTTSPIPPEEAPGVSAATGNEPLAASAQPATEAPPEQSLQAVHDEASEVTIGSPDAALSTASGAPEPVYPEPEMVTASVDEEPLEPRPTEHATPSAAIEESATPPEAQADETDGALESASLVPIVPEPSASDPGVSQAASEPALVENSPSQELPQTEIETPPSGNGEVLSPEIDASAELTDAEAPLLERTADHSEPLPSAAEVAPNMGTVPAQTEEPSGEPSPPAPEPTAEDLGFADEPWQLRPEGQAIEAEAPEPERRVFGAEVPNDPPDVAASVLDGPTLAERIRALRSLPEGTDPAAVAALVARLRAVSDGIAATEPQPRDG